MAEGSSSGSSGEEEEELPPPLFQAADYYFDAQELDGSDSAAAEALYQQAIAVCEADGLMMPAIRAVGCPLRLPAVPAVEAGQSAGQLPPSAVLVSAAHNALGELLLDRTLAGSGGLQAPRAEFEAALHWWPDNAAAGISLATIERDSGHFTAAVSLFDRVAALPLPSAPCSGSDDDGAESGDDGCDGSSWVESWVAQPRRSCVPVANMMLALLRSQLGDHTAAVQPIQRFGFRHRISPAVWKAAHSRDNGSCATGRTSAGLRRIETNDSSGPALAGDCPVHLYKDVVPPDISAMLSQALAPGAAYWKETGYDTREYFSWFIDLRDPDKPNGVAKAARAADAGTGADAADNVVEELVLRLRPLVERSCGQRMVGAEWWTHTRPKGRNVGHQLHYDLEEGILESRGDIVHPAVSSVIYLSGNGAEGVGDSEDAAGPTLVLDQRVDDTQLATRSWLSHPAQGAMLTFPGDRLHGVLPGRPNATARGQNPDTKKREDVGLVRRTETERLTLMIAWWSVPTRELLARSSPPSSLVSTVKSSAAAAGSAGLKGRREKRPNQEAITEVQVDAVGGHGGGRAKRRLRRPLIGPQAILPKRCTRRFTFPAHFKREHYATQLPDVVKPSSIENGPVLPAELPVVQVDQPWETIAGLPERSQKRKRESDGGNVHDHERGGRQGSSRQLDIPHHIDQRFFVMDAQTVTRRLFAEHREEEHA